MHVLTIDDTTGQIAGIVSFNDAGLFQYFGLPQELKFE
jgi:hypothetical protein